MDVKKEQLIEFTNKCDYAELEFITNKIVQLLNKKQLTEISKYFDPTIKLKQEEDFEEPEPKAKKKENRESHSVEKPTAEKLLDGAEEVDISAIPKDIKEAMLKENPNIFDDLEDIEEDDEEEDGD